MKNRYISLALRTVLVSALCFSFASCYPTEHDGASSKTSSGSAGTSSPTESEPAADSSSTAGSSSGTGSSASLNNTISQGSTSSKSDSTEPKSPPVIADITLQIKNNKTVITGFGGLSGVYHGYAYLPDSNRAKYSEADAQLEFDRLAAAGVTLVRTKYCQSWAWDDTTNKWDWNSERMQAFYKWLDEMDKRGIDVALNLGWSYNEITASESPIEKYKNPFSYLANSNDLYDCLPYYAKWGTETAKEIITKRGHTNVKYFMILTEPNNHGYGDADPNTKDSFFVWRDVIKAVHDQMKADGVRNKVKFVGPNSTFSCPEYLNWAVEYANDYVDVYSYHNYGRPNWMYEDLYDYWSNWANEVLEVVKPTGKPYWNDETNTYVNAKGIHGSILESWHGTQLMLTQIALMNAGMQRNMVWTLVDQKWPDRSLGAEVGDSWEDGIHRCGILNDMKTSTIPYLGYYAYATVGKYIKGTNSKVYEGVGENGVYLTMVETSGGDITIIAINMNFDDQNVAVNMDKAINKTLYQHVFDPVTTKPTTKAMPIGVSKTFNGVKNSFTATIPAGGVAVYTSIK